MSPTVDGLRNTRTAGIACGVLLLHAAGLWALHRGLAQHPPEPEVVLAEPISAFMASAGAAPTAAPPLPVRQVQPVRESRPARLSPSPAPSAAAAPAPVAAETPAQPAPTGASAPSTMPALPLAPAQGAAAPAASPVAKAAPSAVVELPSSDADYLHNPRPPYPSISKRLGEQGKVLVRVFIGVDGRASKAELKQGSGFERLDQAALATVEKWRYVPGKRGGVPEAMWFVVPIHFVLE